VAKVHVAMHCFVNAHANIGGPIVLVPAANGAHNQHADYFVESAVNYGIPRTDDYNGSVMNGTALSEVRQQPTERKKKKKTRLICSLKTNVNNGVRASTAHAFLDPIRKTRKNLTIATKVHVLRVVLQGNTATGIEYKRGSNDIKVLSRTPSIITHAKREVTFDY